MNLNGIPILSIITFLPVLGAVAVMLIPGADESAQRRMREIALGFTTADFVLSLLLWANFNGGTSDFQFVERADWLGGGIGYKMGVDGISVLFVVLTAFLTPISILASEAIHTRLRECANTLWRSCCSKR